MCNIIQIMNVYKCNRKNILWGERLIVPFNMAKAELKRSINLSPLHSCEMKLIEDHMTLISQLKEQNLMSYYMILCQS